MTLTDRDLAVAAAEAGAAVVRAKYGKALGRVEKSAGDFATEADVEAEKQILDIIRTARPDDAVLGEESGYTGTGSADRTWLVDPLCGTLNYAAQTTLVAVNVALRTGTEVTAAASADPFTGEVFWAEGGQAGIRRGALEEQLRPSPESRLVDVNLDPPFPTKRALAMLADAEFAAKFLPRVISSTLALIWVAAGRRAAYVTDGDVGVNNMHFASGIALCRAAGCVVTGILGQPVHTGVGGLLVAADPKTHTDLLNIILRTA